MPQSSKTHPCCQTQHEHFMQVIVDGWGRVIKEAEQMDYLEKLKFIPFKVQLPLKLVMGAFTSSSHLLLFYYCCSV